jgi:hypothetical protein
MYKCTKCKRNEGRPHICREAQTLGNKCKCCNDKTICFSLTEIADELESQFGKNPTELYLQALLNSRNMNVA